MTYKKLACKAPGRINIIGDHTDYNMGLVLPAAIDRYVETTIERNGTPYEVNVIATDLGEKIQFDLNAFSRDTRGWSNYFKGIIKALQNKGKKLTGVNVAFQGNVPVGSGLSSSAALENSFSWGLNALLGLGLDRLEIAKIGQTAEHNFVGVQCGLMDQFASMFGKKDHAIMLDCRSNDYTHVPIDLGQYEFVLLNSNVSHELADSDYNTRREECDAVVASIAQNIPSVQSLSDLNIQDLNMYAKDLSDVLYRRAKHVITENERVRTASKALAANDLKALGRYLNASHDSLKSDYEVSCPEIDFMVTASRQHPDVLGCRMMGGGFGGCTINLIKKGVANFVEPLHNAYKKAYGIELDVYRVALVDGASIIAAE